MVYDRVVKCLYCYTNLRFLQNCPEPDSFLVANDRAWAIEDPTAEEQTEALRQVKAHEDLANLVQHNLQIRVKRNYIQQHIV